MDVVGGLCLLACSWWVCEPRRTVKWLQNEESVDWWNKRLLESLWGDEIATPEGSICPSGFCFVFFGKHQMTVAIVWEWICWSRWLFRPLELDRAVADGDIVSCTARGYSNYRFVKLRLWLATSPCLALGFIGFHARQIWLFPSCLQAGKAMLSQHSRDFSHIHSVAANRQSRCLLSVSNTSCTLTFLIHVVDSSGLKGILSQWDQRNDGHYL